MKKLAILLVLLSSTITLAQRPSPRGQRGNMEMYKNLSAEQIASLETKKLTLFLDLNPQQQSQVKELNLQITNDRIAARDQQKNAEKLSPEQRFAKMEARLDQQIAVKNMFKEILNKEQYARWEKQQLKRKRGRKGHRGRAK